VPAKLALDSKTSLNFRREITFSADLEYCLFEAQQGELASFSARAG